MQNGNESNLTDLEQKEQELANRCYQDVAYLQYFPLHNDISVLNYFATSPFFQKTSNNQILISQRLEQTKAKLDEFKEGFEYFVDMNLSKPVRLFVILQQQRVAHRNRYGQVTIQLQTMNVFYCLDGSIFQSPDFQQVLQVRYAKIALALKSAHDCLIPTEGNQALDGNTQRF